MHHRVTYMYINFQQNRVSRSVKTVHTSLFGLDSGKCTVLASLDLTAAFDTVDHDIFLHRLQNVYGICGIALKWFKSYLSNREYRVSINSSLSTPTFSNMWSTPRVCTGRPNVYNIHQTTDINHGSSRCLLPLIR